MNQQINPVALGIVRADYGNEAHAKALVSLLDAYARDVAGGAEPLSDFAKTNLIEALAARPQAYSVLAFDGEAPIGLVNCIEGFSTFACKPLVNVHDVAVLAAYRGQGIAEKMLDECEAIARERGAIKMTLEVLSGNDRAMNLYKRLGYAGYQLDPSMGSAVFMHRALRDELTLNQSTLADRTVRGIR